MKLNRFVFVAFLLATGLTACNDSTVNLVEGGMTGTGISVGTITGFGSIWVNGVRYDVSSATFTRDGASASGQEDYRIGLAGAFEQEYTVLNVSALSLAHQRR